MLHIQDGNDTERCFPGRLYTEQFKAPHYDIFKVPSFVLEVS